MYMKLHESVEASVLLCELLQDLWPSPGWFRLLIPRGSAEAVELQERRSQHLDQLAGVPGRSHGLMVTLPLAPPAKANSSALKRVTLRKR